MSNATDVTPLYSGFAKATKLTRIWFIIIIIGKEGLMLCPLTYLVPGHLYNECRSLPMG